MKQKGTTSLHEALNTVTDKANNRQVLAVHRGYMNIHAEIAV